MTTLAIRQRLVTLSSDSLVRGLIGALLGLTLWLGAAKVYGIARWHLYGRNNERINAVEQRTTEIYNYLVAKAAAEKAK